MKKTVEDIIMVLLRRNLKKPKELDNEKEKELIKLILEGKVK